MNKRVNPLASLSDAEFAALAADKNNYEALLEIERRYEKKVYWYVMKTVHDVPYAEDITLRTFDAAKESFENGNYKDDNKCINWLYSIARHIRQDDERERARHLVIELTEEVIEENDIADDTEQVAEQEISHRQKLLLVGKALHECSRHERLAFILSFIKGLEWEDIGKRLRIKWDSARKDAYRCRQRLWKLLGKKACEDMQFPVKLQNLIKK